MSSVTFVRISARASKYVWNPLNKNEPGQANSYLKARQEEWEQERKGESAQVEVNSTVRQLEIMGTL